MSTTDPTAREETALRQENDGEIREALRGIAPAGHIAAIKKLFHCTTNEQDEMLAYLFWYAYARGWTGKMLYDKKAVKAL